MMRSFVAFLAALGLCHAMPLQPFVDGSRPSQMMDGQQHIIGGTDASPGEFPWQLSQQRKGATWSHSCGASLLSSYYGLSAAHCVDGARVDDLRVIAGLHRQSDLTGTQIVYLSAYKMHEDYGAGLNTKSNDIAILNFASAVVIGGNIQPATLPADNSNNYVGLTCFISGWGLTGTSKDIPVTLQKASIAVITTDECQALVDDVAGTRVWDNHICLHDTANNVGSCEGESGGPLNCPDGVTRVAGVSSWGISSDLDNYCLQTYPSVYTRTSAYLDWIAANTP